MTRRVLRLLAASFVVCISALVSTAQESTEWKAGAASVKITPDGPISMAGYAARKTPSEGVATDLFAKALAIEDAHSNRIVFVTMDLIGVPRTLRDSVEAQVREKHGLGHNSLLMNASHTHCGPTVRSLQLLADEDTEHAGVVDKYMLKLRSQLVAVVGDALNKLAPAKLDFMHGRAGFAMNRRRPIPTGYANAPNFDGPVDHEVPVLRVTDPKGKIMALPFGYACHNTTMGDNLIRGDYAGYAQQYLEEDFPGTTALFFNGCGADQNPYPRRKEPMVRYHGRTLAVAVEAALETVPRPLKGTLHTELQDVALDFAPTPSREELEKTVAAGKDPARAHAQRMLKQLKEEGKIRSSYPCPIQVVKFGSELTLVAIGGETCVDYSLRLKREIKGPAVWVSGYCNDVFGYLPSLRVLKEGGYEAGLAMLYGNLPGPFAESVEERVIGKAMEMARR